jgi:hypothetical protein
LAGADDGQNGPGSSSEGQEQLASASPPDRRRGFAVLQRFNRR